MEGNLYRRTHGEPELDPLPQRPKPKPKPGPNTKPKRKRPRRTTRRDDTENSSTDPVRDYGQSQGTDGKSPLHCLTIIGQIEGHLTLPSQNKTTRYEHILPQLVAIDQNPDIEGLIILLNTVGGDVEAGLAIAEMIQSMAKPTVSIVLGGGHSIGIPIAVAADLSLITPTGTMTIHPIRLSGTVIGVPQTYEYLDKMQDRVVEFITSHSKVGEARLRELMFRTGNLARDIGTILVGQEAVSEGLIDGVGGLSDGTTQLWRMLESSDSHGQKRDNLGWEQAPPPDYPGRKPNDRRSY